MPRLSWNEMQDRAAAFAARWAGEMLEKGDSQTVWSDLPAMPDHDLPQAIVVDLERARP